MKIAMSKLPPLRRYINIPMDRVGVVIGEGGEVRKAIEEKTKTKLTIESSTGFAVIELQPSFNDPSSLMKAYEVISAIANGFSPEKAFKLLNDEYIMETLDLKHYVGDSKEALTRIKGRIIGENGKTRKLIEETTGSAISVYRHQVSIIGTFENIAAAREAIEKLAKGSQHSTVYKFLYRKRRDLKKKGLFIWEKQ